MESAPTFGAKKGRVRHVLKLKKSRVRHFWGLKTGTVAPLFKPKKASHVRMSNRRNRPERFGVLENNQLERAEVSCRIAEREKKCRSYIGRMGRDIWGKWVRGRNTT